MSAGMWGATLFLIAAGSILGLIWHMTKPEPEDPPGITIIHLQGMGWNYIADDPRAMNGQSTGYLTRGSAVRAAKAELKRLHEKDQQTQ